jgi:hypothetical protein
MKINFKNGTRFFYLHQSLKNKSNIIKLIKMKSAGAVFTIFCHFDSFFYTKIKKIKIKK